MTRRCAFFFIGLILLLGAANVASAQKDSKHDAQLRTVHGAVLDNSENPVATGIVYLKNVKTLDVKTHISDASGQYRFSGLDPNVDYEVHAQHEDLCSATRTLSAFDSRKDVELSLKLAHKCAK